MFIKGYLLIFDSTKEFLKIQKYIKTKLLFSPTHQLKLNFL